MTLIKKIWGLFSAHERRKFYFLMILTLLGSIFEIFGISAVVPLIMMLISPSIVQHNELFNILNDFLNHFFVSQTQDEKIIFFAIIVIFIFLFKNSFLFLIDFLKISFALNHAASISVKLFNKYINNDYTYHIQNNSATLLSNVSDEINVYSAHVIVPMMMATTAGFIVISLFLFLLAFSFWTSFWLAFIMSSGLFLFKMIVKNRVKKYSEDRKTLVAKLNETIFQGFGGVKEIKILQRESYFVKKFCKVFFCNSPPASMFMSSTISLYALQ